MKAFLIPIFIGSVILFSFFDVKAQTYSDYALRFSQTNPIGTARIMGIGGANTALGGDASSIYSNPAGLGFYTRSEFTFSPSLNFLNSSSTYIGNRTDNLKTSFNLPQLGIVFNKSKDLTVPGKWRGGSFGISINRINDFRNSITYRGQNNQRDFIDFALDGTFYDDQDNISFDDIYADLAFQTFLTGEFYDVVAPGDTTYFLDRYNPSDAYPVVQSETINTTGAQTQTSLAYGGNYDDKIYFGLSLGISSLNYRAERIYTEEPPGTELVNFTFRDIRQLDGLGINGTFGVIAKPFNELSIGLSYATPTFYSINDQSELDMTSNFINNESYSDGVSYAPYRLSLRTPGRINAGAAYFIGKYGFITGNIEYLDYGQNRVTSVEDPFTEDNADIRNFYQSTFNYSAGGEIRLNMFRLRAGYAYRGDPVNRNGFDRSVQSFSVGGGIKMNNYFVDLGIIRSMTESAIQPYPDQLVPFAITENKATRAILTVGLNF